MGTIHHPPRAKLIAAVMVNAVELFDPVIDELQQQFGPVDLRSESYGFTFTTYYDEEMGEELSKQIVGFERLIGKETLSAVKCQTNQIEAHFAVHERGTLRRRANIDPGYITDSKLVLASTKNFSHRIYLGQGIFAEVTLRYMRKRGFEPLEWTYPDYRTDGIRTFLEKVRTRYMEQVKRA